MRALDLSDSEVASWDIIDPDTEEGRRRLRERRAAAARANLPPIVTPDEVEVITGEEDEEVLFIVERARVYRFNAEEKRYVERGTGPLKILQDPKTKKSRVVMRKGIVHKVCLNFPLNWNLKLSERADSKVTLQLTCLDFSEPENSEAEDELKGEPKGELMTLCFKFKTEEECAEFKKVFEASMGQVDVSAV